LGDFTEEEAVAKQEVNVNKVVADCADGNKASPLSFKAAEWKKAINTKLENLRRKSVWKVHRLPGNRRKLGAR
jgi:hypothetical protein